MAVLTFRSKVLVLPIAAGIALSTLLVFMLWNSLAPLERIEDTHLPAAQRSRELAGLLETLQRELRDAVALEDTEQLIVTDELALRFTDRLATLPDRDAATMLHASFSAYYKTAREVSSRMIRQHLEGVSIDELRQMEAQYVALREALASDVVQARNDVTAAFDSTRRGHRRLVTAMGALLFLCMIGLVVGARSVIRHVTGPLASLTETAQRLEEGDLTATVLQHGQAAQDEVTALMRAFDRMRSSLRDLVLGARRNSLSVAEVAESLGEESQELQATVCRAESAALEIGEAITRVGCSVSEVVTNVGSLSGIARASSGSVSELDRAIDLVVRSIVQQSSAVDGTAEAVDTLASAIGQISDGATTLSGASDRSATSLAEFATAMDAIDTKARSTRELAVQMHSRAAAGLGKVEETRSGMDRIQSSVVNVGNLVDSLSVESRSVGEINRVIADVVDETKLLALNAAIIAAQAGERGGAFAVVSQEIRNLAERTAASTGEIQAIVGRVQEEISDASAAVKESIDLVESGVSLSREAGVELHSIQASSQSCLHEISGIAEATADQGIGLQRVQEALELVREIGGQLRGAADDQARESERVRENVDKMRASTRELQTASVEQRAQGTSLTDAVHELAARIEQIADEAAAQEENSKQIAAARGVVQQAVEQNSRLAATMKSLVATLRDHSGELKGDIERFRV